MHEAGNVIYEHMLDLVLDLFLSDEPRYEAHHPLFPGQSNGWRALLASYLEQFVWKSSQNLVTVSMKRCKTLYTVCTHIKKYMSICVYACK